MSSTLGPPIKNKTQKTPRLTNVEITAGVRLLPTAPELTGLAVEAGEGGMGDAEEAPDEGVKEADASGPILGILQMKIRADARLERKELINLNLALLV